MLFIFVYFQNEKLLKMLRKAEVKWKARLWHINPSPRIGSVEEGIDALAAQQDDLSNLSTTSETSGQDQNHNASGNVQKSLIVDEGI